MPPGFIWWLHALRGQRDTETEPVQKITEVAALIKEHTERLRR
jgi:hypothetical protein